MLGMNQQKIWTVMIFPYFTRHFHITLLKRNFLFLSNGVSKKQIENRFAVTKKDDFSETNLLPGSVRTRLIHSIVLINGKKCASFIAALSMYCYES